MSDRSLMLFSTLEDIKLSLEMILKRFKTISSADDFLDNEDTIERLDSISMRLVAIGEGFKNIDKLTDKKLLEKYPKIKWKQVKGVRDILSHHHFDLDAEVIFDICDNELEELLDVVNQMIKRT